MSTFYSRNVSGYNRDGFYSGESMQLLSAIIDALHSLQKLLDLPSQLETLKEEIAMNKDEVIALVNQRADDQVNLIVAEKSEVDAALAELGAQIEQLKIEVQNGNDLSSVVAAIESANSRVNSAIQDVYTPNAPAPEPSPEPQPEPPVSEVVSPGDVPPIPEGFEPGMEGTLPDRELPNAHR